MPRTHQADELPATPFKLDSPGDIGKIVRLIRKSYGMTQTELAGSSGVGLRFIVDLEKGKPTCEVGKVLHVLKMLGVAVLAKLPVH